jgi:hypothetical protein
MFQLQRNVPIPSTIRPNAKGRRKKYPFEDMKVGDMFFVANKTKNTLGTHVSLVGKELGRTFATRLTYMREHNGKWQPCEADEDGATLGIGVWRTE